MVRRRRHLALSLFSGAGGMDIGIEHAGFDILAAVEMDHHCCDTLRHNIVRQGKATRVIETDIRQLEPADLLRELKIEPGDLDLLFGGPPCQSFSQIGKQGGLSDERGLLLFQMARFAKVFQPKTVLIEQVTGLVSAKDSRRCSRGGP